MLSEALVILSLKLWLAGAGADQHQGGNTAGLELNHAAGDILRKSDLDWPAVARPNEVHEPWLTPDMGPFASPPRTRSSMSRAGMRVAQTNRANPSAFL